VSPDAPKGAASKSAAPAPAPKVVELAPAGSSSDPAVHNLLAHRDIAERNGDQDAIAAINERLAALGVQ
jgi:hypothetical protein